MTADPVEQIKYLRDRKVKPKSRANTLKKRVRSRSGKSIQDRSKYDGNGNRKEENC